MGGRSQSQAIRMVVLGGLAFLILKYYQSHFTGSGVLARAEDALVTDGCVKAMSLYDQAIELGAGCNAYVGRGACRVELKQYDVALDDWAAAEKIEPDNAGPHVARAYLFQQLKRFDEAAEEYDRAAELDSKGSQIPLLRADFLRNVGRLDAASIAYRGLMTREDAPNVASRATFKYAELLFVKGDAKGAETTVEDGLKRWPEDALGLYERGIFRLSTEGRAGDAADDLAQSIEAEKKYRTTSILLNTGIAAQTGEKPDRASYFAFAEPYLPIAINAILFLDAARLKMGQDGADELKKNFDDIEFALRPSGSLQPAKLVGWPIPIAKFYLDEIGPDELMAQAAKASIRSWSLRFAAPIFSRAFVQRKTLISKRLIDVSRLPQKNVRALPWNMLS